jgi:hypothetical protein
VIQIAIRLRFGAIGPTALRVHATPGAGDPLHAPPAGQLVGMLVVDFARCRRVRVNGTLVASDRRGLTVQVDQAYGNCPSTCSTTATGKEPAAHGAVAGALDPAKVDLIRRADTFLLGTTHPARGSDASHRGGRPGFVRVDDDRSLWWPDYRGDNMINSLGNVAVGPTAALLFIDFPAGAMLHLSGTGRIDWSATSPGDDGGTARARPVQY